MYNNICFLRGAKTVISSTRKSRVLNEQVRLMIIKKSKCRDVAIVDVTLSLQNLVHVLFDPAIPTSSFNFIQLFLYLFYYNNIMLNSHGHIISIIVCTQALCRNIAPYLCTFNTSTIICECTDKE